MKLKLKLSHEESDDLREIVDGHGWPTFLKAMEQLAFDIDADVLRYNLTNGPDGLVITKARSEGARALQQAITKIKEHMLKS